MTTCDLWLALAKGDVTPQTKVWREGMPYWDNVANVPEFALALPEASLWDQNEKPPRAAAKRSSQRPPKLEAAAPSAGPEEALPHVNGWRQHANAGSTMEVSTMVPLSEGATPEPVIVEQRDTVAPPSRGARLGFERPRSRSRNRLFPKIDKASLLSVAIGAGFAVIALTIATLAPAPASSAPNGFQGSSPTLPNANKPSSFGGASAERGASLSEVLTASPEVSPPPAASSSANAFHSRRRDRGQQRGRVGTAFR